MKYSSLLLCLTFAFFLFGCEKELPSEACFTTSNAQYTIWEEIEFLNCSKEAARNEWDFGDGSTSSKEEPVHQYQTHGTYVVKLTTYSADGDKRDEAFKVLTIVEPVLGLWTIEETSNVCFVADTVYYTDPFMTDSLDYLEVNSDSTFKMKKYGLIQSGYWTYSVDEMQLEDTTYLVYGLQPNAFQLVRILEDTTCPGRLEHIIDLRRVTL